MTKEDGRTQAVSFWEKYVRADELEKHKLLETLPILKGASEKTGLVKSYISATLLQGYFDDLIECVERMQGGPRCS